MIDFLFNCIAIFLACVIGAAAITGGLFLGWLALVYLLSIFPR